MNRLAAVLMLPALAATPAIANDTTATLGTGGLSFITSQNIEMRSEDLYVSPTKVKVRYEFHNNGENDEPTLVAFPLPDITGDGDFMVAIPTEDPDNIFGFETTVDGKPVDAVLHQYVFAHNLEYTDYLNGLGVPLVPYGAKTQEAIQALSEADKAELVRQGLVYPMEYSDTADGPMKIDYAPAWTLRSTYSWETVFPAGETVTVEHSYVPSVGGTVTVLALIEDGEDYHPAADSKAKYCIDNGLLATLRKTKVTRDGYEDVPYNDTWLQYIWSTGSNWSGPIGSFKLTVDKGDPKNFVSFCWDGEVTKTGPTTFEATATDFWPPYGRELEILVLDYREPY